MKNWLNKLQKKCSIVNAANLCALAAMIYSVNVCCYWLHHQPEVPDEAKRFRKF